MIKAKELLECAKFKVVKNQLLEKQAGVQLILELYYKL